MVSPRPPTRTTISPHSSFTLPANKKSERFRARLFTFQLKNLLCWGCRWCLGCSSLVFLGLLHFCSFGFLGLLGLFRRCGIRLCVRRHTIVSRLGGGGALCERSARQNHCRQEQHNDLLHI